MRQVRQEKASQAINVADKKAMEGIPRPFPEDAINIFWSATVTPLNGHAEISREGLTCIVCRPLHSKADVVYPWTVEVGNGHVVCWRDGKSYVKS